MSDQVKKLPEGWRISLLDNLLKSVIDHRGKTPKKSDSGIVTLSAKSVKMGKINYAQAYYISKDEYKKFMVRGNPKVGDVLMTTEAPLGCIAKLDRSDVAVAQRLIVLRGKEEVLNNDFLRYYLTSPLGQHELTSRSSGSTVQGIKRSEFKKINITHPSILEQRSIASILSSFDDKIELLKQQNKTLEKIAQTIFNEWFGKYQVGDELPEEWETLCLDDITKTINGYSYKGKELVRESENALVTLKSFNRNGGFQTRGFKPFIGQPKPSQEVEIGDLIVAHTDLTQDAEVLGNPAIVFDNSVYRKMFITMDLVKVKSKKNYISNSFLYYLMKTKLFKYHCIGYANGTTVLHLSKKSIPKYELVLPKNKESIQAFSSFSNQTISKISTNLKQIADLNKTRDTLLPKLISGDVLVKI